MDSFLLITVGGKVLLALALWTAVQYAALGPANRRRAQPLANAGLLWRALLGVLGGAALGSALIVVIAGAMLSTGDRVSDAGFLVILLSLPAGLAAAIFCGFRLARRWVLRAQPGAEPAPGPVAEPAADTAREA